MGKQDCFDGNVDVSERKPAEIGLKFRAVNNAESSAFQLVKAEDVERSSMLNQ